MGRIYYKSFDENLRGHGGFQYEAGKEYRTDTKDSFRWFHYAPKIGTAAYFKDCGMRICEVKPLGKTKRFSGSAGWYCTTNHLLIVRELSREEILERMREEKCRFRLMQKMHPGLPFLKKCLVYSKADDRRAIAASDYLTLQEKQELLPPYYHKEAERWDRVHMETANYQNGK